MVSDKTSKLIVIIGAVIDCADIYSLANTLGYGVGKGRNHSANGVEIGGYPVGGYDEDSARQMLGIQLKNKFLDKEIEISYEDIKSKIGYRRIHILII